MYLHFIEGYGVIGQVRSSRNGRLKSMEYPDTEHPVFRTINNKFHGPLPPLVNLGWCSAHLTVGYLRKMIAFEERS